MKQRIIIILTIVLAVCAGLSAQVTVGGREDFYCSTSTEDVFAANDVRVDVSYSSEDKTNGAFIRIAQTVPLEDNPSFPVAYGWCSFFDRQLKLYAGRLNYRAFTYHSGYSDEYGLGFTNDGHSLVEKNALMLQYCPAAIDSIIMGAAYETDYYASGLEAIYLAANYKGEKLGVLATAHLNDSLASSRASLLVGFFPIEQVTLGAGFKYNMAINDESDDDVGCMTPFAFIGYDGGNFSCKLTPAYILGNDTLEDCFFVEGWAEYNFTDLMGVYCGGMYTTTRESDYPSYVDLKGVLSYGKTKLYAGVSYGIELGLSFPVELIVNF